MFMNFLEGYGDGGGFGVYLRIRNIRLDFGTDPDPECL